MELKTLMEIAAEMGVQTETHKLTGGHTGVFIPLGRVEDGMAHVISPIESAPLMSHLKQTKAEWKYVGNFSGIMVMHPVDLLLWGHNRREPAPEDNLENINRRIKRFKIMCDRYRNKRKRHGLRTTLLCGLHNIDLGLA